METLTQAQPTPRGSIDNLTRCYLKGKPWELEEGFSYYDRQLEKLIDIGSEFRYPYPQLLAGAFAALSPNNSESSTYQALRSCLGIVLGKLPADAKVIAYPNNKLKALLILEGNNPMGILRGRKVLSFYVNTMEPDKNPTITVDGHMLGCWCGKRILLHAREANIKPAEYSMISDDIRTLAKTIKIPAPRLQSTLWIVWKRINGIIPVSAQTQFNFETERSPAFLPSYRWLDGLYTTKDI